MRLLLRLLVCYVVVLSSADAADVAPKLWPGLKKSTPSSKHFRNIRELGSVRTGGGLRVSNAERLEDSRMFDREQQFSTARRRGSDVEDGAKFSIRRRAHRRENPPPRVTVGSAGTEKPETDAPGTDAPGTDAPGTDAPGTDAPGTDAPDTDAPDTDAPGTDAPDTDAPDTDPPSTDAPSTDSPKTDPPVSHETAPPLASPPPLKAGLELIQVTSVFRAGARTPFLPLPGRMKIWTPVPGLGRLTQIGKAQMKELGRNLMDYYADFLGADQYFSPARVYARATDHAWTLLSAQAVLKGMFPDRWLEEDRVPQVFPVHVNVDTDDLLLLSPRNCPVYKFALDEQVFRPDNAAWSGLVNDTAHLLNHFRSIYAGTAIKPDMVSLQDWDLFFDPIECIRANKIEETPEKVTLKQMDHVLRVADRLERLRYPPDMGGLLGGPLIQEVIRHMKAALKDEEHPPPLWKKRPSLFLYAGHRETVSALLSVLGQNVDRAPLFGDHVEIELYRNRDGSGSKDVFVRVRHNSNSSLAVCQNSTLGDPCPFDQFVAEMQKKLKEDWRLSCQREETLQCLQEDATARGSGGPLEIVSPVNGLWYVVDLAAGIIVVAVAVLVFWKWKRRVEEGDVPEEVPLIQKKFRGPKKFTLE